MPATEKKIYLTFDDGPVPEITPWVLDVLKKYDIKATFFCVGENVKKHPEIYSEILAQGHATANHTYNHIKGLKTNNDSYFENIAKCAEIVKSNLFRPPYGQLKKSQQKKIAKQYKIIMWDVLSYDYSNALTPEKCLSNVVKNTRNGSVIVFHDSLKAFPNLKFALPQSIEYLQKNNFEFSLFGK